MRTVRRVVLSLLACSLLFAAMIALTGGDAAALATASAVDDPSHALEKQVPGTLLPSVPAQGQRVQALQNVECGPDSDPYTPCLVILVPPTTVPACGSDNDEVVFPQQVGAEVTYDSGWVVGQRTITYGSLPGYYINGFNGYYSYFLIDPGPCLVTLVPPTTVPVCGADNDEVIFPAQVGAEVTYDSGWSLGQRTITYGSLPNYYVDGFNGYYSYFLIDTGPCLVTLVPPTTVPVCGADNDEVIFPAQVGAEVTYDSGWSLGQRTITYGSLPNYYVDGFNGYYSYFLIDTGPCLVTLVPPTTVPVCGANNDQVVFPEQVGAEVTYDSGWVEGQRTITYGSLPNYYVDGFNGYYSYFLADNAAPCLVTIPEPTVTDVCGPNNDIIDYSNLPPGIYVYDDTGWVEDWRFITFAADPGYVIDGGSQKGLMDTNSDCAVQVIDPIQSDVCGYNNDVITLAEQPDHIHLVSDTGWVGNERTIVYQADPGFYINNQAVRNFSDFGNLCLTAPVEPTQTAICGPNNDTIAIPEQPEGIVLDSDSMWTGNVRTITFTSTADFLIEGQSVFEFRDANTPCSTETPVPSPSPSPSPTTAPKPSPDPTATGKLTPAPPVHGVASAPVRVTGLPNTGSGHNSTSGLLVLAALGAVLMALPVVRKARR